MNILAVGNFNGKSNTCLHRYWSLVTIASHINQVNTAPSYTNLSYKVANKLFNLGFPIHLPDSTKANKKIRKLIRDTNYDIVWIDKGLTINKRTLLYIKLNNPKR